MRVRYFAYWGKADEKIGGHHLAVLHCLDVAAVADRLVLASPRLRERISRWLEIPSDAVAPTVGLFVALHDIGKLDARFQAKVPNVACALNSAWAGLDGKGYDHGTGGYGHLLRDHVAIIDKDLGDNAWPLLQAVTGHHGDLPTRSRAESAARWTELRLRALRDADGAARASWIKDAHALFRARAAAVPITAAPASPVVTLLAGLCSVADWIGSNVDFFPYVRDPCALADYYGKHALPSANRALDTLALRAARPSGKPFTELFPGCMPRDVQRVTEALDLPEAPCLLIIEAQMGSGKTEAALSIAERLLKRGDASGVYLALPTMATSNAMLERLEREVPRMFDGKVNLVLAHGRRGMNEVFKQIVERSTPGSGAYEDEATVVCGRWLLGPKRALLGQVGVGTVDQAMLAALRVRHHFVRAYALAESVVVLDEIHAYDAYMQVILDRLIEWLGAIDAPVILLSATLPEGKRRLFAQAYARGAGFTLPAPAVRSPAEAPYPLVTVVSRSGVSEETTGEEPAPRAVAIETVFTAASEDAVLPRLVEAARAGGMVCWIRNTVTDAQAAWEAARTLGVETLLLFHARMRAADRAAIEDRVLQMFGKKGDRRGALLIATQVVEQSLDLDFDLLATDIAPIDLILQRAGRLHRHPREHRPAGCEAPRVLVVAPDAAAGLDFGGSGHVYDRATLGLTLGLLTGRTTIWLPSDIRTLVEAVYDPKSRAGHIEGARNAKTLREAERTAVEKLAARELEAKRACIAPAAFDPVAAEIYYGDDDEVVQALTRDGDSTTLLPVLWDGHTGLPLDGDVPWQLNAKAPGAWNEARALLEQTVSVPAYPWERIERGARPRGEAHEWDEWETRANAFLKTVGLGKPVIVPMRAAGDGEWRGSVQTRQGEYRRLAYSVAKGLWFRREEQA